MGGEESTIDGLLKARPEIDEELSRPKIVLTILFTDVVSSTAYFDRYGDKAGLALRHRMADVSSGFQGRVIRALGDSVMAEFPEPALAVRAAIELQRRILRLNRTLRDQDRVHLRIGIHHGPAFRRGSDVYGDAVNLAAGITKRTGPAQILISGFVHEAIVQDSELHCTSLGEVTVAGKAEKEHIYEVVWTDTATYADLRANITAALARGELISPGLTREDLIQPGPPPTPASPEPAERWQKVEQIHDSAMEREPSQRANFVKEACGGDESLRREVESLLAQEGATGSFQEAPALEVAARGLAEESSRSLVGRQIASYQVLSLIGAGGMGEVYRAHDRKLGREIAIKVLPKEFSQDPERLGRLEREARLLASLNHPHVGAIYAPEESDGVRFLVLELVAGETLAERLKAGPLEVPEALRVCAQIAEALEAAHERGVIHRDLKPANVKVTPEGQVKVLDFGLAKALGSPDLSQAPTVSAAGTETGVILGTPAYMSPEQARGKAVDKRTDIWSFGCVLYELLTVQRAFTRATVSDTIAAILEREPDWEALPQTTPASIQALPRRCLRKDSKRRHHDMADARIEIEEVLSSPVSEALVPEMPVLAAAVPKRSRLWLTVGAALLATLLAGILVSQLLLQPVRTNLAAYRYTPLATDLPTQHSPAWSPDGKSIAYLGVVDRVPQVFVRSLDSPTAVQVTREPEECGKPFWSADSRRLFFWSPKEPRGVWSVAAVGGEPESVLPDVLTVATSPVNEALVVARQEKGLWSLGISSPPGSPPRKYELGPLEIKG